MIKKIAFQITLFLFLLTIISFFYYEYFFLKTNESDLNNQNQDLKIFQSDGNVLKNIRYSSTDKNGNEYLITSEYGEVSSKDINVILMTNVTSQVNLYEKDTVYINSKFATYNSLNFETNFHDDVVLIYSEHKITSEHIDLSFKKNFVWVYDNIIYNGPNNELFADKLEIDLLTKDSRIFMINEEKIKIIKK